MYLSYEESKQYLKNFNIKSSTQFYSMVKEGSFIEQIHKRPYNYFRTKKRNHWVSWKDFLSIPDDRKKYLNYKDAIYIVHKLDIKDQKDWFVKFRQLNLSELGIPSNPNIIYKNKGWSSYSKWLGINSYRNITNIKYLSYLDCKKFINKNFPEIKNKKSWVDLDKSKLPLEIPKRPDYIYREIGWINWESFLDSGSVSPISKSKMFFDYNSAKDYLRPLMLKDRYEYHNYINNNNILFLPKRPDVVYKNTWKGYIDFLGCVSNRESIGERLIKNYLDSNNILYIKEKKFETCKNKKELPFDFYLPAYNLCIEYDGELHYRKSDLHGGEEAFNKITHNDKIKTKWCKDNDIKLLRISYLKKSKINKILEDYLTKNPLL